MTRLAMLAALTFITTGCARALGESCAESSECAKGTTCVLYGGRDIVDGGLSCSETKKLCSITCAADADCASLGAGHICVKDCFSGSCLVGSH